LGLASGDQNAGRADPRAAPYVWVTWVAQLMAGAACQWRYWFQARHFLNERATTFGDPTWHLKHSRLVTELEQDLRAEGLDPEIESEFTLALDEKGAQLAGRIDCLVDDPNTRTATVYECKTADPRPKDQIQVLLYMNVLTKRPRFRDKGIRGELVYPGQRHQIRAFPEAFDQEVDFWLRLLMSDTPPRKVPGSDCRFCPITRVDCPERYEPTDGTTWTELEPG
jgi:CRISPR/Cas system-associated exonuclease Cas4 (RecB family)